MPSKNLCLWAVCGGFAAAHGPQKGISGAAWPPPNPHRVSRVIEKQTLSQRPLDPGLLQAPHAATYDRWASAAGAAPQLLV